MKITYDKEANAAYVYFRKGQKVARTLPITNDIVVDFSSGGKLLGIEILNASSYIALNDLQGTDLEMLPA